LIILASQLNACTGKDMIRKIRGAISSGHGRPVSISIDRATMVRPGSPMEVRMVER
jgi:hypothetical protein